MWGKGLNGLDKRIEMEMQDAFLLDEVRNGFLVPAAMKQAWAGGMEVLKEIDRVCKKHNIQWFADWGTLLGTVRHGGHVPWDDDLDIVMKREDYIKFMTVARFDMEEGFDVQTFRNHDDCWLFMGKVVGRNGFCFEKEHLRRFHNFPYIASVDVFVLDYVYRDEEKEKKRREACKYILAVANLIRERGLIPSQSEKYMRLVEEKCGYGLERRESAVETARYLYGVVEEMFAEVPEQEADCLIQLFPWGLLGKECQFPKSYYENFLYLPYEYMQMPVPSMYDEMLRKKYGNYMRLVKDAGAHEYPFFEGQKANLQKVLDFKLPEFVFEKDKLFRSEEENAYRNQSYKELARECLEELGGLKEQISQLLVGYDGETAKEEVIELLQSSQQLAVDLGNMLESFRGENSVEPLLEQYCEDIYAVYEQLMSGQVPTCHGLEDGLRDIAAQLEQEVFLRKCVLFLPVMAKDWGSLHAQWEECVKDSLCDVFVVPLPYYYKEYDGSARKVCYELTEFPKELGAMDYQIFSKEYLEMLHPEKIVIQNPYDGWNPVISVLDTFYSEKLRRYTDELLYVSPYQVEDYSKKNERAYFNMKYYVTMPGVVYSDRVVVQSENLRQIYIDKLTEFAGEWTRSVWEQRVETGRPVSTEAASQKRNGKKRILYGISMSVYYANPAGVRKKLKNNLVIFEAYKECIDVTIQLFPNDKSAEEARRDISSLLKDYEGKMLEEGALCDAKDFDAFYGDSMPLIMEFKDAGKATMLQDIMR